MTSPHAASSQPSQPPRPEPGASLLPPPYRRPRVRLDAAVTRAVLSLPPRVQRLLAGRPVTRDGQTLDVETQLVLRLQRVARLPEPSRLPVPAGRALLDDMTAAVGGRLPVGGVRELDVAGCRARLYTPRTVAATDPPPPLLVFFHGGGFFQGGLDSHDAPCRLLAERARVAVLAVDYRLAPEHPFPAAHDDAVAAFRWALKHAAGLGADPARVAVGGDSAGGNLSAWVAVVAAREGLPLALQLLVYPATEAAERDTWSSQLFAEGFFLTRHYMDRATALYTPEPDDRYDERISPMRADLPEGLAPAVVATAGFDPLRDEGEAYARKLADAGVDVVLHRYDGLIHGFFNTVGVGRHAPAAVTDLADRLWLALHRP